MINKSTNTTSTLFIVHCSPRFASLAESWRAVEAGSLFIRLFAFCSLIIVHCSFAYSPVLAQSLSLSISPPIAEIMIQPGRQITLSYQLANNSEKDLTIIPSLKKLIPANDRGLINFGPVDRDNPINFSFESQERLNQPFTLGVGEIKQLVLKMTVDPAAPEKDYYHTLLFSTGNIDYTGNNQTSSITQIGSNLLVTISKTGKPILSGEARFDKVPKIIDSFSPLTVNLLINNTGNTLFKPFGKVILTGWFDQKQEINLLEQNVLAGSVRRFVISPIRFSLPIGRFTVKTEFQPNQIPPNVESSTTVYYVPYKLLVTLLILLIAVRIIRRVKRKQSILIDNLPIPA